MDGKCALLMILKQNDDWGEIRKLNDTVDRDDSNRDRKKEWFVVGPEGWFLDEDYWEDRI